MAEEFVKFERKKSGFVPFLIKILLFVLLGLGIYFLFLFNIIKKEYFGFLISYYETLIKIVPQKANLSKFIIALFILVISNLFLGFYLIFKPSNGKTSYKVKSEFAMREKKMEEMLRDMREEMNNRKVKFSSILLRYKDILGNLEKDKIMNLIFNVLNKSSNVSKASIFLIDEYKEEIFMVSRFREKVDKDIKIKLGDKNIIAHAVNESRAFNIWEEDSIIKNLFKSSPLQAKIVAPIIKDKVSGVLVIEEFDNEGEEEYIPDDEAKLIITTTASLAAISLDKASVFEMTQEELQSEKKFSAKQLEEKKTLRNSFQKYTSPAVVEELIKNPDMLKLGGKKDELTVLFSDIVGFTTYSEKYGPEKVVSILNEYLTAMTDVIMDFNGTLDKFVGDEIMAIWGAPVSQDNHAELSVRCGFAMLAKLEELTKKWIAEGVEPFDIGIGINTGEMIVGNMGSPKRMDYTVIGDSVNAGARIESLTRQFKTNFIVSESTYLKVKDIVEADLLGKVSVKGKSNAIKVYKLKKILD